MPLSFPFTEYAGAGAPVTFYVGPTSVRFDVHHFLLAKLSPLFLLPSGLPRIPPKPIELPTTDPDSFRILFTWLYTRQPPAYTKPTDLLQLMKLWVTASTLGIWRTQNTILRLGMELMQPPYFVCSIDHVRWVYAHIPPHSPLRAFIITIFTQRSPPITPSLFSPENEKLGIFRDAAEFLQGTLNWVRAGNPRGVDGYVLEEGFEVVKTRGRGGRVLGCVVTGGREVDWGRVEWRLPRYLVWDEWWGDLPDRWFVGEEGVERGVGAGEVVRQFGIGVGVGGGAGGGGGLGGVRIR